jgi:hypothetical protein
MQKKCLSLILYQDSFEVANLLGSAKQKYKLMGFYNVLGNLESHNRSAVDHIQIVMLARETDLGKVGQRMFWQLVDVSFNRIRSTFSTFAPVKSFIHVSVHFYEWNIVWPRITLRCAD